MIRFCLDRGCLPLVVVPSGKTSSCAYSPRCEPRLTMSVIADLREASDSRLTCALASVPISARREAYKDALQRLEESANQGDVAHLALRDEGALREDGHINLCE